MHGHKFLHQDFKDLVLFFVKDTLIVLAAVIDSAYTGSNIPGPVRVNIRIFVGCPNRLLGMLDLYIKMFMGSYQVGSSAVGHSGDNMASDLTEERGISRNGFAVVGKRDRKSRDFLL